MAVRNNDAASLLTLQRDYILAQIRAVQTPGVLYTLILDDVTEQIVDQVVRREQLLRLVASVEKLDARRKQQTFLEAIYLVEPTVYGLNCVVGDAITRRYRKGWGLFLPLNPRDTAANAFYHSTRFLSNPKVQNYFDFGENIRFTQASVFPVESRVFLADSSTPNSMPIYFNENCSELVLPQVRRVARGLVNLMVITGEYPLIRFYSPQNPHEYKATRLSELIADEFQRQIDDYARSNEDFPPDSHGKPRSILLIADRSIDLYAPLLHEFTYQALAMDIIPSLEREGIYKYQSENEKGEMSDVVARVENEHDEDWVNLRHLHIIESSELIINKINELIANNPLMVDRSRAKTSSDLMHIVANLKGFDDERKQITLHRALIDECLDRNGERKLAEFAADFEQTCCAEGVSFEGIRNKQLHDDLIVLLARDDLETNDKIRLVLIYGLYRGGLCEADFVKIANFIKVKSTQMVSLIAKCFYNLRKLGFPIVKTDLKQPKVTKKMFHTINNDGTYNTSRFGPGIKSVLQFLIKYQLDETWFPYFRDKPLEDDIPANIDINHQHGVRPNTSLRNTRIKASWAQSTTKLSASVRAKQRIFCYVAGGITYSEMRSVYELSNTLNKDFYIGSESILKPRDFLIGLQDIDQSKEIDTLDLHLYKELTDQKEPPVHLFESQERPQLQSHQPQAVTNGDYGAKKPAVSAPGPATNGHKAVPTYDFQNFNAKSAPTNHSVPSHYQKRTGNVTNLEVEPEKTKKTSRLKKLFK